MIRAAIALWLVFALGPFQQTRDVRTVPTAGTATLTGTVVADDGSNTPIRRAVVSLSSAELPVARELSTDDQGHFAFAGLPAGALTVTVSKPGYVTTYYGARRPGRAPGQPILLAQGQTVANVTVKLIHGASISGTVFNQNNQGQYDMRVRVFEYQMQDGGRTLVSPPLTVSGGLTDDRGNYRLWGLPPGTYVLSVTPEDYSPEIITRSVTPEEIRWAEQLGRSAAPAAAAQGTPSAAPVIGQAVTYVPVYFPGVTDPAGIETITVGAGEDRVNANVKLPLVRTARVEGIVIGPDGQPVATGLRLSAVQPQPRPPGAGGLEFIIKDGHWTIPAVPPGRYTLIARAPSRQPGASRSGGPAVVDLFALLDLTITGQDVTDLVMTLERGGAISGRVTFDGRTLTAPKDMATVRITMTPAPGSPLGGTTQTAVVAADGTFAFVGATPGRYRFTGTVPASNAGWTLASAMLGDRDALDSPFDVRPGEDLTGVTLTFSDQRTELSGSLVDANGAPADGYLVIVFSADRAFWTVAGRRGRVLRPGPDGKFSTAGLPPGDYQLGVVADVDHVDLGDTGFLEALMGGSVRVKLGEGEKRVQGLKVAGRR